MIRLLTSKNEEILLDDEDWPLVAEYTWCLRNGYAATTVWVDGVAHGIYMHRLILGLPPRRPLTDHKNLNRADNRRPNLRICTHAQNSANRRADKDSKTGVKGVSPDGNRFVANIMVGGQKKYLGSFGTIALAKEFRDLAADMLLGEFARAS